MAVRNKSRRKLKIDGRQYLWFVKEDDFFVNTLHVISEDKRFIVQYNLAQPPNRQYVTVIGNEFGRVAGTGGVYRRFRCPRWDNENGIVSSRSIRNLIEWCAEMKEETTEVDYDGRVVPLGGCCTACGVDVRGMIPLMSDSCHKCGHPIAGRTC